MTKEEAIYNFFSGFEMDAYPVSVVPDVKDVTFPYITYDNTVGNAGDPTVYITAQVWFRTESETTPNAKIKEISDYIGLGGVTKSYDGGLIWIKRGTPWCNSLVDDTDATLKRRVLNIDIDFM